MDKKSLLILFICSFLCVVFTINTLCSKYLDERFVLKYNVGSVVSIEKNLHANTDTNYVNIFVENTKLIISFAIAVLFFFETTKISIFF